jgi:hypothetical protein
MPTIRSIFRFTQGPTFQALSGERRRAYIRQWKISMTLLGLFALSAVVIVTTATSSSELAKHDNVLLAVGAMTLLVQLVYALFKSETLWQLRLRELRARKESSIQNERDLHEFIASVQHKDEHHDKGSPRV